MLQIKDNIDQNRYRTSQAGKLIAQFIRVGLLNEENLNIPEIVDFINNFEIWTLDGLDRGNEVVFINTINPKGSMVKGSVVYKGMFQELAYNDKTLVNTPGIRIQGQPIFPKDVWERFITKILQRQIDLTFLRDDQRIFRRVTELTIPLSSPFILAES